jgi:type IV pilus assembly protein PilO
MPMDMKDPRLQKAILVAIALAGVLYCYFFTTWVPFTYRANASQVGLLEDHYREMSKDLNKARQAAHSLPYLEKEYDLLHRKWEQSRSLLPEHQDMPWLLRTITLLGTQSGVEFTLFRPLPSKPAQYHTEDPIEIRVRGGYHQIGAFLAELANLDRIVNVTDLEITSPKDREEGITAEAGFVASTYTLGGTGVPPEQAKQEQGTKTEKKAGAGKRETKGKTVSISAKPTSRGGGDE